MLPSYTHVAHIYVAYIYVAYTSYIYVAYIYVAHIYVADTETPHGPHYSYDEIILPSTKVCHG